MPDRKKRSAMTALMLTIFKPGGHVGNASEAETAAEDKSRKAIFHILANCLLRKADREQLTV